MIVKQGAAQNYIPTLYIQPNTSEPNADNKLMEQLKIAQTEYPGIDLKKEGKLWEVIIPDSYKDGHEAHFARVTEKYLEYLRQGDMPAWEVPNMIAKYYVTTTALDMAKKHK